jgi:hypothetical protein
MYFNAIIIKLIVIFDKDQVQFRIRLRIHNLELRIRILQKVSDPFGRIRIHNTDENWNGF